jgi:hypothetical protein
MMLAPATLTVSSSSALSVTISGLALWLLGMRLLRTWQLLLGRCATLLRLS